MQITNALGKLTPAHPDLMPILVSVREKYNIPEIAPGDPTLAEIVGADNMPNVEAMRDDIEQELRKIPDFLPEKAQLIYKIIDAKENDFDYPEMDELSDEMRKMVKALMLVTAQMVEPYKYAFDIVFSGLADHSIEYLLTGTARELPEDWFMMAGPMQTLWGDPVIIAMGSELADPREVAKLYKAAYRETFGEVKPKLTNENEKTLDSLRMNLEGKSINYLVGLYEENHPSEFPSPNSKQYKKTRQTHYNRTKINLQRLNTRLDKILGTKS
jgi:hypothetical protein